MNTRPNEARVDEWLRDWQCDMRGVARKRPQDVIVQDGVYPLTVYCSRISVT